MTIRSFTFSPFETNTYVLSLPSGQVLLIDPACWTEADSRLLGGYIDSLPGRKEQSGVTLVATHGHLDHLFGAAWATRTYGTPVLMHPEDIPMATAMQAQYDLFGIDASPEPFPIAPLPQSGGSSILPLDKEWGGVSVLHTPGHTPGSVCFYFPEDGILFSGDTLFRMGYGRTDLPGGSFRRLMDSLDTLFSLSPGTRVYPGHGAPTTIAAEAR